MRACGSLFEKLTKHIGISFGDVIDPQQCRGVVIASRSGVLPKDALLETRITKNITIPSPFIASPMDTVTEAPMAIALAQLGGVGVIHRNLSVEEQARQVAAVKHHIHGGLIDRPVTAHPDETIGMLIERHYEYGAKFHTFPVVEHDGTLVGLITGREIKFAGDPQTRVRDTMITYSSTDRYRLPLTTAPEGTTLDEAYVLMCRRGISTLPLVDAARRLKGLCVHRDIQEARNRRGRFAVDARGQLRVGAAVGTGEQGLHRADALARRNVDFIVVDSAHGHAESVLSTVQALYDRFPGLDIVAGNVATAEGTLDLIEAGASAVKIGQGLGGTCTTGIMTGVAPAQLTALYEAAKVADAYGVPLWSDGGVRIPADVAVALIAGARAVMIGTLFAGTDEAPGEKVLIGDKEFKKHRGMGSTGAMHAGGSERYRQTGIDEHERVAEGVEGRVPYRGSVRKVVSLFAGGLRNTMGYVGARTIEELREKGVLQLRPAGSIVETLPHDMEVTEGEFATLA